MGQGNSKNMEDILKIGGSVGCGYVKVTTSISLIIALICLIVVVSFIIKNNNNYYYEYVTVVNDPTCDKNMTYDRDGRAKLTYNCNNISVKLKDDTVVDGLFSSSNNDVKNKQKVYASISKNNKNEVYLFDNTLFILQILSGVSSFIVVGCIIWLIALFKSENFCKIYGGASMVGLGLGAISGGIRGG